MRRFCEQCDLWLTVTTCPECGARTSPADVNPREKGDDDGVEYGDPRDHQEGRE